MTAQAGRDAIPHPSHTIVSIGAAAAVVALMILGQWVQYGSLRDLRLSAAMEAGRQAVQSFDDHTVRLFEYTASRLIAARAFYLDHGADDALRGFVASLSPADITAFSAQMAILDPDGRIVFDSSSDTESTIEASPSDALEVLRSHPQDQLRIAPTRINPLTRQKQYSLSRPIFRHHVFSGLVTQILWPEYLIDFYRKLDVGPNGAMFVITMEHNYIVRYPEKDTSIYEKPLVKAMLWSKVEESRTGMYFSKSVIDGIDRYYFYRKLNEFPVIVVVGVAVEDIYAPLRKERQALIVKTGVLAAAGAAFCGLILIIAGKDRHRRRLERAAREAEEARRQRERESARERAARLTAESANQAKSQFLANMSHELRTPLNAILGFCQVLERDGAIGPPQRETLGIIRRSGAHLLSVINDILDMAKIEAGRISLAETDVDFHKLVADVAALMGERAAAAGQRFTVDMDTAGAVPLPRHVHVDAGKLRQVLINLIGNAVKYGQGGGVSVRVACARVEPAGSRRRYWMVFDVEDNGRGIAAEDLERIFDPFVQVGDSVGAVQGTGLGLSITRQFVLLMGGSIRVASRLGAGSVFTVELPVVDGEEGAPASDPPRVIGLAPGQPPFRIAVVDDSETNRILLARLLRDIGLEVRPAADGGAGVDLARQWRPDLVWMDLRMPGMDGYEATRRILALPDCAGTVVVALTASAHPDERDKVLACGCRDLVRKPFHEAALFEVMGRLLGMRFVTAEAEASASRRDEGIVSGDAAIPAMDGATRTALRAAVRSGDLGRIRRIIDGIARNDPALAHAIESFTREFRYRPLLDLLARGEQKESPTP